MLTRGQVLDRITGLYDCRMRGDTAGVMRYCAPNATYRMAGDASLIEGFPAGPARVDDVLGKLIELFTFHERKLNAAIVGEDEAALYWTIRLSHGPDGPKVDTAVAQHWRFNDDGKITALTEYADTALIRRLME